MRFTAAWAEALTQNATLRTLLMMLGLTTMVLAASTARLAAREPLIVERGCASTTARIGDSKHSNDEIEAFVRSAVAKRFDTKEKEAQLILSGEEFGFRLKEQEDLKSRGISQRVIVNEVSIEGTKAKVDADRVLTAGSLRTALPFPLVLELSQTDRTAANPYGLIIARVSQSKPKEDAK